MVAGSAGKYRRGAVGAKYGVAAVTFPSNSGMRTGGFIPRGWRRSATSVEKKAVDFYNLGLLLSSTGSINCLNLIATGSSFYNRIGRQVKMKSIRLTGYFRSQTEFSDLTACRIAIVYDSQTNGVAPTFADVWQDYNSNGATNISPVSGLNLNNRDRFRILCDEKFMLPKTNLQSTGDIGTVPNGPNPQPNDLTFDRYINLRNLVTQYKSDLNTTGDISTGGLFLITYGSSVGTAPWTFACSARLRYYD